MSVCVCVCVLVAARIIHLAINVFLLLYQREGICTSISSLSTRRCECMSVPAPVHRNTFMFGSCTSVQFRYFKKLTVFFAIIFIFPAVPQLSQQYQSIAYPALSLCVLAERKCITSNVVVDRKKNIIFI